MYFTTLKHLSYFCFLGILLFYFLAPIPVLAMETKTLSSASTSQTNPVDEPSGGSDSDDSDDTSDGSDSDDSDGTSGGSDSDDSDGTSGGSDSGDSDGTSDGSDSGDSDGTSGGSDSGDSDGTSGGSDSDDSDGTFDGSDSGDSDGTSDGSDSDDSDGTSDGSDSDDSDGTSDGSDSDDSDGTSDGSDSDDSDGTSGGSDTPNLGASSGGSGESTDDGSISSDTDIPQYTVQLSQADIPQEGALYFTTIHHSFANKPFPIPPDMYPGSLTIEITEPIYIPSGVSLEIGTLSIGGTEERPVIKGQFSDTPLITLEKSASLTLRCVDLDIAGDGILLKQEDGSSFHCIDTTIPEDWLSDSTPIVNHENQTPDDIWLLEGTVLENGMLPASLETFVQQDGNEIWQEIAIQWDLQAYDGRTSGEITLSGTFFDAEGNPMQSLLPLEITIHWYQPGSLSIQDITWKGNDLSLAQFTLPYLPETVCEIWGEVSEDNEKTWESVPLSLQQNNEYGIVCAFSVPSGTAYHCRLAAMDRNGKRFYSESVCRTEDGDDTEGNRGGATTPNAPDREPTYPSDTPPTIPQTPDLSESLTEETSEAKQSATKENVPLPAIAVRMETITQAPITQNNSMTDTETKANAYNQNSIVLSDTQQGRTDTVASAGQMTETTEQTEQTAVSNTIPIQSDTADTAKIADITDIADLSGNADHADSTAPAPVSHTAKSAVWKQAIFAALGIGVCIAFGFGLTRIPLFRKPK